MRKRLSARLLSVVLSATMAFSPAVTAYATDVGDGLPVAEDVEEQEEAGEKTQSENGEDAEPGKEEGSDAAKAQDEDAADDAAKAQDEDAVNDDAAQDEEAGSGEELTGDAAQGKNAADDAASEETPIEGETGKTDIFGDAPYTVTFNLCGGYWTEEYVKEKGYTKVSDWVYTISTDAEGKVARPADPTKTGESDYGKGPIHFDKWTWMDPNDINHEMVEFDFNNTVLTADATIIASYYSLVTFVDTDNQPLADPIRVTMSGYVDTEDIPKYEIQGYDVTGWEVYTDDSSFEFQFDGVAESPTNVYHDITLHPVLTPWTYSILFATNDVNAYGDMPKLELSVGETVTLPANRFINPGKVFAGWNTLPNPTEDNPGILYSDKQTVELMPKRNGDEILLFAQWEQGEVIPSSVNIYFSTFGGTLAEADKNISFPNVKVGDNIEVKLHEPTKYGSNFLGWYGMYDYETGEYEYLLDYDDEENVWVMNVHVTSAETNLAAYAKWEPVYVDITLDGNGAKYYGTQDTIVVNGVCVGDSLKDIIANTAITRAGYFFAGWNTERNGSGVTVRPEMTLDRNILGDEVKDITFYAQWEQVSYKATFHSNNAAGKTKEKTKTFTYNNDNVTTDVITYKSLFGSDAPANFKGWSSSDADFLLVAGEDGKYTETLTSKSLIAGLRPASATVTVDLYAQYESAGSYYITFDPNLDFFKSDANFKASDFLPVTYAEGDLERLTFEESFYLTGKEFSVRGYNLDSWTYETDDGREVKVKTNAVLKGLTTTSDRVVVLTAKWKKVKEYTVKYDLNGGTIAKGDNGKALPLTFKYTVNDQTREGIALYNYEKADTPYGWKIADATDWVVTKRGYRFNGWGPDWNAYYGKNLYTNMNLKADWQPYYYKLTFDCNGGYYYYSLNGTPGYYSYYDVNSASFNNNYSVSNYIPTRPGYTLKGFEATLLNGKTKVYSTKNSINIKDLKPEADGNYKVVAQWTANSYKITYDLQGGKMGKKVTSYKTDAGSAVIAVPTKDCYRFDGWEVVNTSGGASEDIIENSKVKAGVYGNLTLTAVWVPLAYDIEFYSNDGSKKYIVNRKISESEWEECYKDYAYAASVNFRYAADFIEEDDEDLSGESLKGFATAPGSSTVKYDVNHTYSKLGGKKATADGNDEVIRLYAVATDRISRISYLCAAPGGKVIDKGAVFEYKSDSATAITTKASCTGYKFLGWTPYDSEDIEYLVFDEAGEYVTGIKAGTNRDLTLVGVFEATNKYSISLLPNAADVVDASDKKVAKSGIKLAIGGSTEFSYESYYSIPDYSGVWSRKGYTFVGFSENAKATTIEECVNMTGRLGGGKAKNVKLYAIWKADQNLISYDDYPLVLRSDESFNVGAAYFGITIPEDTMQTYGKAVTPKKYSVAGFVFKGYKVVGALTARNDVTWTDKTKTYVKTVTARNDAPITLRAVFEENTYTLYYDPAGGTYMGSTRKQKIGTVYYRENLYYKMQEFFDDTVKKGYSMNYLTTTKNSKGAVAFENYYNGEKTFIISKTDALAAKGSVTLTAVWYKMNPSKPVVYRAEIVDDILYMTTNVSLSAYTVGYVIEFQYSQTPDFKYAVKTEKLSYDPEGAAYQNSVAVSGIDSSKECYVRIRYGVPDSSGECYFGPWSTVTRATRIVPAE